MPSVWNKEVTSYVVNIFESNSLADHRSLQLTLEDGDRVSLTFPGVAPDDFVNIGNGFHRVEFDAHKFDEIYHLLQTEKPVFFTAYEIGSAPARFAGISTSREPVGEGFADPEA